MKTIIEHKFTTFDVNQSTYLMCIGACVIAEPIFGISVRLFWMKLNWPSAMIEPHKMENKHIKETKSPMGMAESPTNYGDKPNGNRTTQPTKNEIQRENKRAKKLIFYHKTHKPFSFIDKTTLAFHPNDSDSKFDHTQEIFGDIFIKQGSIQLSLGQILLCEYRNS